MSNYTVLQQNVLASLETEDAQAAFLWACDKKGADRYQYNAEAFAREVDRLSPVLDWMLERTKRVYASTDIGGLCEATLGDLKRFMLTRHANIHHPGKGMWEAAS